MRITVNGGTYVVHTEAELLRLTGRARQPFSRTIVRWALRLLLLVGTLTMVGAWLQAQHRAPELTPCVSICNV